MHASAENPTAFFWDAAAETLAAEDVQTGTMMGFPCLRVNGAFFASCEHRTGDLIVKLPQTRVQQLIATNAGKPFAPAGRTFREWLLVTDRDIHHWRALITEAQTFVASEP